MVLTCETPFLTTAFSDGQTSDMVISRVQISVQPILRKLNFRTPDFKGQTCHLLTWKGQI